MLAEVNGLGVGFPVYSLGPTISASEIIRGSVAKVEIPILAQILPNSMFSKNLGDEDTGSLRCRVWRGTELGGEKMNNLYI